ncbi:hypothetical protein KY290_021471 [Solanum tuberosum]|uniref:Retrotransposon Copia-like N-terminal domain-containing protein n=1 Tax=Solanum tuberosum TaxID=4113 RepID=A0ABQ7V2P9_SOLTU|nr:hypothetical protein KY289_020625 [Solanum tuberosum]KAH0693278.1 hypothetical protein KY285_020375 [Solanum tuberosum]KAH0757978.1 hypothetical protein KY290_021471 [Solanum tuberosum]
MAPTPSTYDQIIESTPMFDRKSYGGWRRVVIIVLSAKSKPGFTDGSLVIPIADLALQKAWSCCNDMILSCLLNSLSRDR